MGVGDYYNAPAAVVELADTPGLGSGAFGHASSTLASGTTAEVAELEDAERSKRFALGHVGSNPTLGTNW